MSKKTIIIILLALVAITGQTQTSFDPDEGCLNVIDISYAQGIGEYGDEGDPFFRDIFNKLTFI